jgi:hypothetical protein
MFRWAVHGHKPKLRVKPSTLHAAQEQDTTLHASQDHGLQHAAQEQDTGLNSSQDHGPLHAAREQDTRLHPSQDQVDHKEYLPGNFREEFVEFDVTQQYDLTNFTSMISTDVFSFIFCQFFVLNSSNLYIGPKSIFSVLLIRIRFLLIQIQPKVSMRIRNTEYIILRYAKMYSLRTRFGFISQLS